MNCSENDFFFFFCFLTKTNRKKVFQTIICGLSLVLLKPMETCLLGVKARHMLKHLKTHTASLKNVWESGNKQKDNITYYSRAGKSILRLYIYIYIYRETNFGPILKKKKKSTPSTDKTVCCVIAIITFDVFQ